MGNSGLGVIIVTHCFVSVVVTGPDQHYAVVRCKAVEDQEVL